MAIWIDATILKLKPKYSMRVRALFRRHRALEGIQPLLGTVALMLWKPGRQKYTDRLVHRLINIGAVNEVAQ